MILATKVDFWRRLSREIAPDSNLPLFLFLFWALIGGIPIWIASSMMIFGGFESGTWLPIPVQGILFAAMGAILIKTTWQVAGHYRWKWLLAPLGMILFFALIDARLAIGTGIMSFAFLVAGIALTGEPVRFSDD